MKKKTKRTLIVLLCVVVFIVAAGIVAYNVGVNYLEKKLVSSVVEKMIDSGEINISDLEAMVNNEEAQTAESVETPKEEKEEAPDIADITTKSPASSVKNEQTSKELPKETSSSEQDKEETVDKFTENLINSISRKEKLAMVRLITSHLSGGDIRYLASLLAGGLTREERAAAYRLAKQRFSADELEVVSNYYHRYKAQVMIEPDLVPKKK